MIEKLVLIIIVMFCLPWTVYLSVKLGTYAYFRGRSLFHSEERKKINGRAPKKWWS